MSRQDLRRGITIDVQEDVCHRFAAMQGPIRNEEWVLLPPAVDRGKSAYREDWTKRTDFVALLDRAKTGAFHYVLVYMYDRFSRHTLAGLKAIQILSDSNVFAVSASEPIDYSTPYGRRQLRDTLSAAEYYSDQLSARMKDVRRWETQQGRWVGPVPVGFVRVDGKLRPDAERCGAIELYARLRADGRLGAGAIAQALNEAGWTMPSGAPFTKTQVEEMDLCVAYAGHVRCGELIIEDAHEPLIDRDAWARIQAIRSDRSFRQPRQTKRHHLLTGLATCPCCGSPMWNANPGGGRQYSCKTRITGGNGLVPGVVCPGVYARAEAVDAAVLAWCKALTLTPDLLGRTVTRLAQIQVHTTVQSPRRSNPAGELRKLREQFLDGELTIEQFREREAALAAEPLAEPVQPHHAPISYKAVMALLANLTELLDRSTAEHRQAIVRNLIVQAYVRDSRVLALRPTKTAAPLWEAAVEVWRPLTEGHVDGPGGNQAGPRPFVNESLLSLELPDNRIPVLVPAR